jgi:oxygen-independent coproporphyrinogen-3 oxidase
MAATLPPAFSRFAGERIPRYTSYPTAPFFTPAIGEEAARDWIASLGAGQTASLYFHVPFCRALCRYCGCTTQIPSHDSTITRYVDTLIAEIAMVAALTSGKLRATHLHWGGGTPAIIGPSSLHRMLAAIRNSFRLDEDAELAIEIDPRTLTPDMAEALGETGFTRASLGVQTFDPEVQRDINRIQSFDVTAAAAGLLRQAGIGALNIDLIYGLPHQTVASCVDTVRRVLALDPDRISVFGYAHVPAVRPLQRRLDETALPDAAERFSQAEAIAETLVNAGYRRIGLDHFAKPGDGLSQSLDAGTLRRNFQGYTTDRADALLGFGASSIGSLPQGYIQNNSRIASYQESVATGHLPVFRGYALSDEDRLRADIIERLMCDLAVDLGEVADAHHVPGIDFGLERAALANLAEEGLVEISGNNVTVPESMRPFVRKVASVFDALQVRSATHAAVV